MKKLCAMLLLTVVTAAARSQAPPKDSDIRQELAKQAKIIAATLRAKGEPSLAIGHITGPPNFPSSSGAGLALILAEELEKNNIKVKPRANLGLRGTYNATDASWGEFLPGKARLAVEVKLSVVDIQDKAPFANLKEMVCLLAGEGPVLSLLAPPVALPRKATGVPLELARDLALREALKTPEFAFKENSLRSNAASDFAVQILVDGKAIDAVDDDGLAYLKLQGEKPFAVKLLNNADHDVAVRLAIDGIDAFAFSEDRIPMGERKGEPRFTVFVVGAKDSLIVKGWHLNDKQTVPFQLKGYGKDAVALARHNDTVGTITARFSAAWGEMERPPSDEPPARRAVGDPPNPSEASPDAQTGAINRQVGIVRSVVSARFKKQ